MPGQVHCVPHYQAWCKPCGWYGAMRVEREAADSDLARHHSDCASPMDRSTPPDATRVTLCDARDRYSV